MKAFYYIIAFSTAIFTVVNSYSADKFFRKLGKYEDVTIIGVDREGVRIMHAYGATRITEDELNDSEKTQLQEELDEVKTLKQKYQEEREAFLKYQKKQRNEYEKQAKAQTEELTALIQRIEQMNAADALKMLGEKFATEPFSNKLSVKMLNSYKFATNRQEIPALIKKLKESYKRKLEEQNAAAEQARKQENVKKAIIALDQLLTDFDSTSEQYSTCEYTDTFSRMMTDFECKANEIKAWHPGLSSAESNFLNQVILAYSFLNSGYKYLSLSSRSSDLGFFSDARKYLNEAQRCKEKANQYYENAQDWLNTVRFQQMKQRFLTMRNKEIDEPKQQIQKEPVKKYDEMAGCTYYYSDLATHSNVTQLLEETNWRNPYYFSIEIILVEKDTLRIPQLLFHTNIGNVPVNELLILFESGTSTSFRPSQVDVREQNNPFGRGVGHAKYFILALKKDDYLKYFVEDVPQKIRFIAGLKKYEETLTASQKIAIQQMAHFFKERQW